MTNDTTNTDAPSPAPALSEATDSTTDTLVAADPELTRLADIYGAALDKWADIELWRTESFDAQTAVDNAMSELCGYVREHYGSKPSKQVAALSEATDGASMSREGYDIWTFPGATLGLNAKFAELSANGNRIVGSVIDYQTETVVIVTMRKDTAPVPAPQSAGAAFVVGDRVQHYDGTIGTVTGVKGDLIGIQRDGEGNEVSLWYSTACMSKYVAPDHDAPSAAPVQARAAKTAKLSKAQRRVLANLKRDTFAIANSNGVNQLHYNTYGKLREAGLVEFDHYGYGRITDAGKAALNR